MTTKYRLKKFEILEENGNIYFVSPSDKSVIMQCDKSFKWFSSNCFDQTFIVADTDKVISENEFRVYKELFEEVKDKE